MNGWKTIIRSISIFIILIGIGFLAGFLTAQRNYSGGDPDDKARIVELEGLYAESESTNNQLRGNIRELKEGLAEYFNRNAERYSRAREIIAEGKGFISEGEDSIGRALRSLDRMSRAINILFAEDQNP